VNENVLSLEEAVQKMTSFAAGVLGIDDRGIIKPGMYADLLIFDPAEIHERASFPDPLQLSTGFDVVIVNGQVARGGSVQSGNLFGRVLKP
jgi:N-acyl-D-amino-acid deacylase